MALMFALSRCSGRSEIRPDRGTTPATSLRTDRRARWDEAATPADLPFNRGADCRRIGCVDAKGHPSPTAVHQGELTPKLNVTARNVPTWFHPWIGQHTIDKKATRRRIEQGIHSRLNVRRRQHGEKVGNQMKRTKQGALDAPGFRSRNAFRNFSFVKL